MIFLFLIGVTGILLGWKKNSGGLILAETVSGTTTNMEKWLPLHTITEKAKQYLSDTLLQEAKIDRIDVRPDKGVVKFTFKNNYFGLQVDGATAQVLLVEHRYADLIEQIHDGSIVDKALGWKSGIFKLFYTSLMGLGLMLFCISGFWLWYGPKLLKR
jgi:uncharacterized iron-regulated membrane protein